MKKIFSILALAIAFTTSIFAQGDNKNQLTISAGLASAPSLTNAMVTVGTLGEVEFDHTTSAISAQYLRFVTSKIGLGATVSFEHQWGIGNLNTNSSDELSQTDIVVMPTVACYWYRNHFLGIYSKAAAGIDFIGYSDAAKKAFEDSNNYEFAYQVSPASIEIGSNNLRFFTEVGFGYQGIVNLGVHYSF